jgi:hypothetical protein
LPKLDHLSPVQRAALDAATAFVHDRYTPWGVLAAGTIIRGESDPHSDIDLYVLHDAPFRQRVQRRFSGIPVEIFVNTVTSVLGYLDDEEKDGRPSTAHMLATGVVLRGEHDPRMGELQGRAQQSLASRPEWKEPDLVGDRYGAATAIEDALDRRSTDPETAMRLLMRGVDGALSYWYKKHRAFIPREKELLSRVVEGDQELDRLMRRFWGDHSYAERWDAGIDIADRVLETRGFFEWESERDSVPSSV